MDDRWEAADDARKVVSVFWCQFLDGGDAGRPECEKGDEDYGTVGEREADHVVSRGRYGLSPATAAAVGKWD